MEYTVTNRYIQLRKWVWDMCFLRWVYIWIAGLGWVTGAEYGPCLEWPDQPTELEIIEEVDYWQDIYCVKWPGLCH